jgi:hypothetical protein
VGWLRSYEFLEDRHVANVDGGPALLVEQTVVDGRLPDCVAETTATWLLGRPVTAEDEAWLAELSDALVAGGWSFRQLVKDVVLSDRYRRVE